jgi:hypothetical protein
MSKIEFKQTKNEMILNLFILKGNKRRINIHVDTNCIKTSDDETDSNENRYDEVDREEEEDEMSNDDIYLESDDDEIEYDEQEIELNDDDNL